MIPLKEDVVSRILLAETEYHDALEKASRKAQAYEEKILAEQNDRIAEMERQWLAYEQESEARYRTLLLERSGQLEEDLRRRKQALRQRQQRAAEAIAERLKEEVLSQYGSR